MGLTKNFKTTIMVRAQHDPAFCEAMLSEAVTELLSGDMAAGKAILRDYINATISFEVLSQHMQKHPKSVMRMLSPQGNPASKSLLTILHIIQELNHLRLGVTVSH